MIQYFQNKNIKYLIATIVALGFFSIYSPAQALEIKDAGVEIKNDFVLEPAKTELTLDAGEKATRSLSIVNRTDREQTFSIDIEDFTGSKDPTQVVKLLGNDKSPYTLKDFIKPEVDSVKLKPKQRAIIKVDIDIPSNAEPGGRFASILVSTEPTDSESDDSESKAKTISRLGALYFVRVSGPVKEDGKMTDLRLVGGKTVMEKGPFNFEILFENNSSVHLTPSGHIEIKNMLGRKVKDLEVSPFFSLPASLRGAQITWDSSFAFGRYTATAYIDRGYRENTDVTDEKTIVFWVLPWKVVVGLILAIIIIFFILRKVTGSFEIKRRR